MIRHTRAPRKFCILKNSMGHIKLNTSCRAYTLKATVLFSLEVSAVYIRYEEMPIRIYSTVHTTGNSQLGGERGGFSSTSKISILFLVINAESPPTRSGIRTEIINGFFLIFTIIPPKTYFT